MAESQPPTIAGIAGSRRDGSHTRTALTHALEAAAADDAETRMLDLRELTLPVFDPSADTPPVAAELTNALTDADAIILATPMYHGSYSGALKNALDYCGFDEFEDKTVGLLAVSGGSFPITALDHLRAVCRALDAWVLPYQAAVPRSNEYFGDGELLDADLRDRVETLGHRLVRYARIQEYEPPSFESQENVGGDL